MKNWSRQDLANKAPDALPQVFGNKPSPEGQNAVKAKGKGVKQAKYRNRKVVIDGIEFHSAKEGKRYGELKMLEKAGEIAHLNMQSPFEFKIDGKKIFTYYADFVYYKLSTNREDGLKEYDDYIVEDVKSEITRKNPVYRIKKKLIEAQFNIKITEV